MTIWAVSNRLQYFHGLLQLWHAKKRPLATQLKASALKQQKRKKNAANPQQGSSDKEPSRARKVYG